MTSRNLSRRCFVAAATCLPLLLAACSSDSGNDTTGTSTGSTPAKVVKIGVIAPLDKGLTEFGAGIRNSVKLAVDEANARQAIPGYSIQMEAVDDSSDPAVGEAAAKTLAADATVVGVVGPYNSGVAAKAAPVLSAAGIALVSPSNTDPALTLGTDPTRPVRPNKTYFRMVGTDIGQAQFLAHEAKDRFKATKVAVINETKAVSKGLADNFAAEFRKDGGDVAVQRTVPDGADNFTDALAEVKTASPSMIFFGGEYPIAAKLREQATAAGITVPIMGGDGMKDAAYIKTTGKAGLGDLASSVGAPTASLSTAQDYVKAYAAAGFAEPTTDYGVYSYDAANLLINAAAEALKDKSGVTPETRSAVVTTVQGTEGSGASGKISFDVYGDARNPAFTLYEVRGEPEATWQALPASPPRPRPTTTTTAGTPATTTPGATTTTASGPTSTNTPDAPTTTTSGPTSTTTPVSTVN